MLKIGMSTCAFPHTEESFKNLSENGISAVEISRPREEYDSFDYKEIKSFADNYGITLWSYHLPFMPFREIDISSCDGELRRNTLAYLADLIEKAADIGIDKFVIHPSGEPIADDIRAERMKYSMESLDFLAEFSAKRGAIICVEDLPRTCLGNCAEDILKLTSANDKLRVCFDTNHLLLDNNLNFIEKVGKKIATVHVSDYDFLNERHWLPGEGDVDWKTLYDALMAKGYNGVWMYELGFTAPPTIARDRDLIYSDYRQNALTIFEGKTPAPIGKRMPDLKGWK